MSYSLETGVRFGGGKSMSKKESFESYVEEAVAQLNHLEEDVAGLLEAWSQRK